MKHFGRRSLGSRVKAQLLYWRVCSLTKDAWRRCYRKIYAQHPEYRNGCDPILEREHQRLWNVLNRDVNLDTLRVCAGISGICDPLMVPEEVFASDVQRCLNHFPEVILFANKSVCDRWFQKGLMPLTMLHNLDGDYFDEQFRYLRGAELLSLMETFHYPLVVKPNRAVESGGGRDVLFISNFDELKLAVEGKRNFVVQEQIRQHSFFERLTGGKALGINTIRACTYRSVDSGEIHFLHAALRMGRKGCLDNIGAGGIACFVNDEGRLNKYATDKYGGKYDCHPDTEIRFSDVESLPDYGAMKRLAVRLAGCLPLVRLVSFDLFMDEHGAWRLLEVNLFGHTIGFSQYSGRSFLGPFTREVIDFCKAHPDWR